MGTYDLVETLSLFGESLIRDDASDLGYFTYRNRKRHKYHGKHAPHHPSPFHHYQIGSLLVLASYIFAPIAMATDMQEDVENS